jgi:hypothetical protein
MGETVFCWLVRVHPPNTPAKTLHRPDTCPVDGKRRNPCLIQSPSFDRTTLTYQNHDEAFSTAGQTDQRLTLRTTAGATVLTIAPVFAYEQANPAKRVAGHYEGELVESRSGVGPSGRAGGCA